MNMACQHNRRIGDNYGISCMDCGAQLAGYGNNGEFASCLHEWYYHGDIHHCMYCQREIDCCPKCLIHPLAPNGYCTLCGEKTIVQGEKQ